MVCANGTGRGGLATGNSDGPFGLSGIAEPATIAGKEAGSVRDVVLGGLEEARHRQRTHGKKTAASGGATGLGPAEAAVSGDATLLLDQPAVTTSWATSTNTSGFKFIAYVLYNNANRDLGSIRIRRSRSPIFCFTGRCHAVCPCVPTFGNEVTVATGNVASPQVAVDNNGAVHVTYVRYNSGSNGQSGIEEAIANVPSVPSTQNISFGAPQIVA